MKAYERKGGADMRRGDIWLVAVLLVIGAALAVPLLLPGEQPSEDDRVYAKITVAGEPFRTIELTGDTEDTILIETARGRNTLHIHDGGIEMHEADCPDQLCLSFGHIRKPGQQIVCLPNRVIVEIIGGPAGSGGAPDVVVS